MFNQLLMLGTKRYLDFKIRKISKVGWSCCWMREPAWTLTTISSSSSSSSSNSLYILHILLLCSSFKLFCLISYHFPLHQNILSSHFRIEQVPRDIYPPPRLTALIIIFPLFSPKFIFSLYRLTQAHLIPLLSFIVIPFTADVQLSRTHNSTVSRRHVFQTSHKPKHQSVQCYRPL